MMEYFEIWDILFIVGLVLQAFIPKSKFKYKSVFWIVFWSVLGIRIYSIYHKNVTMVSIKKTVASTYDFEETIDFALIRTDNGFLFNPSHYKEFYGNRNLHIYSKIGSIYDYKNHGKLVIDKSNVNRYFFDIFEISFFNFLYEAFQANWVRLHAHQFMLFGKFKSTAWPPADSTNVTKWIKEDILKELNGNMCLPKRSYFISSFYLPPNVTITTTRNDKDYSDDGFHAYSRIIIFENDDFKYKIEIVNGQSYPLEEYHLNFLKLSYLSPKTDWVIQNIQTSFKIRFKHQNIFTDRAKLEREWANNIKDVFNYYFNWENIEVDLRR